MQDLVRAAVASLIKAAVAKTNPSSIEDASSAQTRHFRGSIAGSEVQVLSDNNEVNLSGALPQLYEYGSQTRFFLKIDGTQFTGYDYSAQAHFNGQVNGSTVSLYDFAASRQFTYR
jgi:hypothetical protein